MTWRVIDIGCEGCRCSLQGSNARMEVGTLVQSSVGNTVPSTVREEPLRTVADSVTDHA